MGSSIYKYKEQVIMVLKDAATGKVLLRRELDPNIVTNVGDTYYAQRGAASLATFTFNKGMCVAANSGRVSSKAATFQFFKMGDGTRTGRQSFDAGYPKANDTDTDNTGRTVDAVTYKRTYTTAQANYTIKALGVCRVNATSAAGANSRVLLSYKTLSAAAWVTKTSSQTLVLYINHLFNGV